MTTNEEHRFEVDVIVRGAGQPDAVLHREYTSTDSASTDKALSEVWGAVSDAAKSRMSPVNDGR